MASKSDAGTASDRQSDYDYFANAGLFSEGELITKIEEFSNSYSDHGSVDGFSKRMPKTLTDVQVLHDTKATDKFEDIGHKLYLNIGELLRAVDKQLFPPIIANNYDIATWIKDCRENRNKLQVESTALQTIADETLLCPEHHITTLRSQTEYVAAAEQRRATFFNLSTEEQDAQLPLKLQLQELKESITAKHDTRFLLEYDSYKVQLTKKNEATVNFRAKQLELKRLYTFESVLEAFLAADRQIVSIIQKAVTTHCISLKTILQGTARLPTTKEEIPNPWDSQSLAGIACIMHERFHKRSFVTFNNYLLEAMGFHLSDNETKYTPMKAVAEVQKMMYNWESRDLWSQMSPDHFWSAVLLRSLHPTALIRQELLHETHRFLQRQHETSSTAPSLVNNPSDKHPLFTFAATYLQTNHDAKKFASNSNLNKTPTQLPQTPGANGSRYKPGGLELAAAASTTTSAAAASSPATTAPSSTGPNPHQQDGKTIYTRAIRALPAPVLRTANIYFQHNANGNPKRYLAVPTVHDICSNCFPVHSSSTTVPCQPPCTSRLCPRCNYYGHNGPWCLQTHTTSGVLVPQNTAASGVTKN